MTLPGPQPYQPAPGNPPPGWQPPKQKRRRWPWVLAGIFALLILLVSIGSKNPPASPDGTSPAAAAGSESTACTAAYPDKQASDVCADSAGTVTLAKVNGLQVTATPLAVKNGPLGKSLCTDVTIKNVGTDSQSYNVFDFKVQTPSGDVATTGSVGVNGTLNSGTLIAGGTKTGKVCSDGAVESGQYVFIYKPNAFMDTRGIWLFTV